MFARGNLLVYRCFVKINEKRNKGEKVRTKIKKINEKRNKGEKVRTKIKLTHYTRDLHSQASATRR